MLGPIDNCPDEDNCAQTPQFGKTMRLLRIALIYSTKYAKIKEKMLAESVGSVMGVKEAKHSAKNALI